MNLPASLLACLGQRLEEVLTVHVIEEDVFTPIPAAHHACRAVGLAKADGTSHLDIPPAACAA
jgi:hypothetical protein